MRNNYQAVSVPTDMIKIIDKGIKGKGFSSRAEFVKQAIRNELERLNQWTLIMKPGRGKNSDPNA